MPIGSPVNHTKKREGDAAVATRWEDVLTGARLADMREVQYRQTLALASLIELLVTRGILDREELARTAQRLDAEAHPAERR